MLKELHLHLKIWLPLKVIFKQLVLQKLSGFDWY